MKTKNRYIKYLIAGMAFFALVVFVVAQVASTSLPTVWRTVLGLAPLFPTIFAGLAIARAISEMDELQQRIQLEAFVFSLATVSLLTFALGLFHVFTPMIEIGLIWVLPMAAGFWAIGLVIARQRYR